MHELRRMHLPRTRVNEGKEKDRDPAGPRPCSLSSASLLAHQLVLGLIHQPFLFPLFFCWCCGFRLPWLGDGAHLLHRPKQIILGPLLNKLATLVKAVYLDARHLDAIATPGTPKNSPSWVPLALQRLTTLSPSTTWSSTL